MNHLETINQRFLDYLRADIDTSVELGLPDNLHRLGDPSLEAQEARVADARTLLGDIEEAQGADFYEKLDLQLIRRHLQLDIFFNTLEINGELERSQKPAGVDGISEGIFQLFVNDERSSDERLADILSRLRQAPDYLQAELAVVTRPVARWRDIEIEQAGELPELFESILDWARNTEFETREALAASIETVNAALSDYVAQLQQRPTVTGFTIGRDKMEELLAIKQIEKSPDALRAMAAEYMAETRATLKELQGRLLAKYELDANTSAAELQEFLNQRFAVTLKDGALESILDIYQQEREYIRAFIEERQLFPIPEDEDMVIMMTPGFLEPVIPAGAMWPPLPLREGTSKSMVHLTLKEDELAEHTHLGICNMMIHEGIPGHHLQFASAARQPSLIRRFFDAAEHAEGWTTMLEDYMLDIGCVSQEIEDEVRFIAKRDISRLVARVGIDLYFMSGDPQFLDVGLELDFDSEDPFENAAKLLKAATGFTDGRVQSELNWYSREQGYPLSYLTGNRLVWELKTDLSRANPGKMSQDALDREFHRIYLQAGCMPVASLREVFRHEGFL